MALPIPVIALTMDFAQTFEKAQGKECVWVVYPDIAPDFLDLAQVSLQLLCNIACNHSKSKF